MKKILIILILFVFSFGGYFQPLKIIKYNKLGKLKYDCYDSFEIKNNYILYYKKLVHGIKTNYIYGDFDLITYDQYLNERKDNNK